MAAPAREHRGQQRVGAPGGVGRPDLAVAQLGALAAPDAWHTTQADL